MATTQSPGRTASESPRGSAKRSLSVSTRISAMSVLGSRPTISASTVVPSEKATSMLSTPSITWLLVTM